MTATVRIRVGKNVGMSSASICAAVSVEIGEGTIIGAGVVTTKDVPARVAAVGNSMRIILEEPK